jgi:hypothetical protein
MSLTVTGRVQGQTGFFLGIQAGYSAQKPSLENIEFSTDTSYLYGLRAGFKFLMLGIEVNYFQAAHNLDPKEMLALNWSEKQLDYSYLGLNLKYFFPVLVIHPYVTVGYGNYKAAFDVSAEDRKRGFNAGLGVELHLGGKVSLIAEGKYHRATLDIDGEELKLGDFTLSGGLNIYF